MASATRGCWGSSSRSRRSSPGSGSLSPASGGCGSSARCSSSASSRCSTWRSALDPTNPPDSVLKFLEQDRYYRWCTYVFIPIQYAGLVFACWMWSSGDLTLIEEHRPGADDGGGRRDRDQHRARARPQAGAAPRSWLSRGRPRADRLRPLLHRAQPRPPRQRRHPRGPGQLAARGELLGLPAAHRRRQPALGLGDRDQPRLDRLGESHWSDPQRRAQRLGDDASFCSPAWRSSSAAVVLPYLLVQAVIGFSLLEVVNYLEHYGLRAAEARGRPLRALHAGAQLEQQQRRLQRPPLPPAAPLRPPRQPDPSLPGAAPRRRGAAAADRLRGDDRPRLVPAALAPGDGPARCSSTTTAT